MRTNVSTLLREFPKIRRAVLGGEEVIVATREGDLRITAVPSAGTSILGSLKDLVTACDDSISEPTTDAEDWEPSL
ncbi:MAG: hypothetical protein O3A51_12040 [Verrucomicrobia bacterium]|nr:hypothetical protein [Verrucomicrobiota bacterium]